MKQLENRGPVRSLDISKRNADVYQHFLPPMVDTFAFFNRRVHFVPRKVVSNAKLVPLL